MEDEDEAEVEEDVEYNANVGPLFNSYMHNPTRLVATRRPVPRAAVVPREDDEATEAEANSEPLTTKWRGRGFAKKAQNSALLLLNWPAIDSSRRFSCSSYSS